MSETTLICDLFQWLPPWGEFNLRQQWEDNDFVIEVDYEVGEAQEWDKPIFTRSIRFAWPIVVVNSWWPLPRSLSLGPITRDIDRGQIYDLGSTQLLVDCIFQFRRGDRSRLPELHHYYVYFDDMKQTFQVVAQSVEVGEAVPAASDG